MAVIRSDSVTQNRSRWARWLVLGTVLVGMTVITIAHQSMNVGKPAGVDALCPFGGLETLFSVVSGSGFIKRTAASALVLFATTLGLALVYRRSFCGQLCPLGALQGLFGALGARIFRSRPLVPAAVDRWARYVKYGLLAFFVLWTWRAADLVMRPYDPWAAYAHLTSDELFLEFGIGFGILLLALVGSFAYDRAFCKYLCPMGASLGLLSKISAFRIQRDADTCIDCGACDRTCPMNITVSKETAVTSAECISCNECLNSCPVSGALEIQAPSRRTISPMFLTGLVVALVVASIGVSQAAGAFAFRMPTLAESLGQERSQGNGSSGSFDLSLIKGRTSLQEISDATGIPAEEFTAAWGVSAADLAVPMKDIKDAYGFTPEEVRAWVGARLGE
jgi:NAD-dependent dihydropyrimidine dehydrogenase PreA subunit